MTHKKLLEAMKPMRTLHTLQWSPEAMESLIRYVASGSTSGPLPGEDDARD